MKVIGIVGGIGAGKTTVVELIKTLKKAYVISADHIGHKILLKGEAAYESVIDHFGKDILDEDGQIMRKELGKIVFSNSKELIALNAITHPLIYNEIVQQIETCKREGEWEIVVVEAALLVEVGLDKLMDSVLGVYTRKPIRIKRIMKREGFTAAQAKARIKAQKKWVELKRICDDVIDNSKTMESTKEQLEKVINKW